MDLKEPITASHVAEMIGAKALGNTEGLLRASTGRSTGREGDLALRRPSEVLHKATNSAASVVLDRQGRCGHPEGKAIILSASLRWRTTSWYRISILA
ncbi:MAG: hypothetical protein IPP33_06145 [Flavobacteriales bacterium]|nr:hypothetical protein [Flavobacteriales bacterium]